MKKEKGIKISHNKSLLVFIILLVLVLVVLLLFIRETPETNEKECVKDEDCIRQQVTCCSCKMGGVERCMSRENAVYWQDKLEECKEDIFCTAMYNCKEESCRCAEGKCE